jgi:hypothetical protein
MKCPLLTSAWIQQGADWETILAALQLYKEKFSDVRVPSRFVIPRETEWPAGEQEDEGSVW